MTSVVFSAAARGDLRGVARFIATDNPRRARSFVGELEQAARSLADQPLRFPLIPRFEALNLRARTYGNYLIVYVVQDDAVVIARILHSAMDVGAALDDWS